MKKIAFLVSICSCLWQVAFGQAPTYQPTNTRHWDLLHTTLQLTPQWETQQVVGNASLTLVPYFYAQNSLVLDAKGFTIQSVESKKVAIPYVYDGKQLTLQLPKNYERKDTLQIQIAYVAKPNELPKGGSEAISGDKGFYFITPTDPKRRQAWTQGETEANSCWFPTIDSPNEQHTHDIYLNVEKDLTTLSNGALITSKSAANGRKIDHWQMKQPHAVYLTMVAIGNFVKTTDTPYNGKEIAYYTEAEHAPYAKQIFGRTPEMLAYFEQLLGVPYVWNKYSQVVVREYVSGAMENTTASVFGDFVLKNNNQLVNNHDDGIVAHELFHHWFGDLVTCESWSNLPLNESFADYSEYLWMNHKYGTDEGDWTALKAMETYKVEAEQKQVPLIRYNYAHREDMFDSHSYAKGGRILHWLRKEVGDAAFFASLKLYLQKNAHKNVEIHDLRLAFEEVTGRDLNWFFNQWFFQPGHPKLLVKQTDTDNQLKIKIEQQLDSANSFVYQFPLDIVIGTKQGLQNHQVWVNKPDSTYAFALPSRPTFVQLNPKGDLIADIWHEKPTEALIQQFYASKNIYGRLEALDKLLNVAVSDSVGQSPLANDAIRQTVLDATKDKFWGVRQRAIQQLYDYDGKDFLLVEKALQYAIRNDAHAAVRADAILAMKNFLNPQNDILFREALQDTAYAVRGAALEALLTNQPPDAEQLINRFKEVDDVALFAPIASYYADQGKPERLTWFQENLQKLSDTELYQVMGIFGTYLVKTDETTQAKALPFVANWAEKHPQWYVRFAAMRTLMLLSDLPTAAETIDRIMANETNEKLRKVYNRGE